MTKTPKLSNLPILRDEAGHPYRKCPASLAPGYPCEGRVYVWERVRITGSVVKKSKPWVSCTEARYCQYYADYKAKEWPDE